MQTLVPITRRAGQVSPQAGRSGYEVALPRREDVFLATLSAKIMEAIVNIESAHSETVEAFWLLGADLYCGHPCGWRAVAAPLDELVQRFGVAFGNDLHSTVAKVARPAGDAERLSL
jgi:hypothetical protein